jgi:hypothetical protein
MGLPSKRLEEIEMDLMLIFQQVTKPNYHRSTPKDFGQFNFSFAEVN